MNIEPYFLPDILKRQIEALALSINREGNFGYVVRDGDTYIHTMNKVKASKIEADVLVRFGGDAYPSLEETTQQIANDRPMVVVVLGPLGMLLGTLVWGDFLLDYPLIDRPFTYGIFDCYEAVRSWKWQHEGEKLRPVPREPYGWWRRPIRENPNSYLKLFNEIGYSEFKAAPITPLDLSEPTRLTPRVGDGLLIQTEGQPVVNHVAIYVGYGNIYHHFQGRKSEVSNLRAISKKITVRKWLRKTELLKSAIT